MDGVEEPIGEGVHFPALEIRWGSVMIEDCNIFAQQGSGAILGRDTSLTLDAAQYDSSELRACISTWLNRTPMQTHDPLGLLEMASQLEVASR